MATSRERNLSLDLLKLAMALMVVGLHAAFLEDVTDFGDHIARNGIFRLAVPVFLVINGFYFWPTVLKGRYRDWLWRVFVLYLIWMTVYGIQWLPTDGLSLESIGTAGQKLIFGYFHLWYLAGMLGAAVLLLLARKFSTGVMGGSIVVTLVIGILLQYAGNYHVFGDHFLDTLLNYNWIHRNALFFAYPFFSIGYLINKHSIAERFTARSSGALTALGLLLLLAESSFNYARIGSEQGFSNLVSIILLAPALFVFFTKLEVPGKSKTIAYYSSSIYFVHIGVLLAVEKLELGGTVTTVVTIAISSLISVFVVRLNSRVGYIL